MLFLKESNKDQSKVKSMQISLKKNGNRLMVFKIAYTKTKYTDYHVFSFLTASVSLLCCYAAINAYFRGIGSYGHCM